MVDTGLERALLATLTDDAPTAATLGAAETAIGTAWTAGADLILCAGADRPAVRAAYNAAGVDPVDRPAILPTAGGTPGTAVMLATGAVHVEASLLEYLTAERPRELGRDVVGYRYGIARTRVAGAVQVIDLG